MKAVVDEGLNENTDVNLGKYKNVAAVSETILQFGIREAGEDKAEKLLCSAALARILASKRDSWITVYLANKYLKWIYSALIDSICVSRPASSQSAGQSFVLSLDFAALMATPTSHIPPSRISLLASTELNRLMNSANLSKTIACFLELSSVAPHAKYRATCGRVLSSLTLRQGGLRSLLNQVILAALDEQGGNGSGDALSTEFVKRVQAVCKAVTTVPKQCPTPTSYLEILGSQVVRLVETEDSAGVLFHVALQVCVQLVNAFPEVAGRVLVAEGLLGPLRERFYGGALRSNIEETDLDGNPVILSEEQVSRVFGNLKRLLQSQEPSFALLDALQFAFIPLYCYHELAATSPILATDASVPAKEILKSLLRMTSPDKCISLLSGLVRMHLENIERVYPRARVGPNGGVMFVQSEGDINFSFIQDAEVFVEFLIFFENDEVTCGVFLNLLEDYIKSSSSSNAELNEDAEISNLLPLRILMLLMDKFGPNLIRGTRRVVELVKSIVVDSHVDTACLLLCLTILKGVLIGIEDDIDVKALFDLRDFLIVLQTLEWHADEGIRVVACDVRRLILIKSGDSVADPAFADRVASEKEFAKAMLSLADPLLPIRAEGIDSLRHFVLAKDPVAQDNMHGILCAFLDMLADADSFIYLHAVNGLAACVDAFPQESLRSVVERYGDASWALDYRVRVGEVAGKVVKRAGPVFGKYAPEILPHILRVLRDEHKELRGSAISLLGVVAETAPLPLLPFLQQILDYVENTMVLQREDTVMRQGAVLAILCIIRGMYGMYDAFPRGTLKRMYTRLKMAHEMDPDELTRYNAGIALEELRDAIAFPT
ncbi:armadillo-type protein [Chytriomyces sp. MP71]|nr:armadillo-type protein [Chytriomyces sp. MP71]